MQPRKLNVFFGFPSYGGNGGISSEVPDIRQWFTRTILQMKSDERIGEIGEETKGDTPITMVRNHFVKTARAAGADVLVMVDSDIHPLKHERDPGFRDFWQSSFDFLYEHYDHGPVVIGAPYCGPPNGSENVYVFRWDNCGDRGDETAYRLDQYTRHEASQMIGIQECAALPTGLIMYDMRLFDLIEPSGKPKEQVIDDLLRGDISRDEALRDLSEGWFYYEWEDGTASKKASTEDVTNTRDISLAGSAVLGYNPVYCNWDSPVGHWKPWCVEGRPRTTKSDQIAMTFRRALDRGQHSNESLVDLGRNRLADLGIDESTIIRPPAEPGANGNGRTLDHITTREHIDAVCELVRCHHKQLFPGDTARPLEVAEIGTWTGEMAKAIADTGLAHVTCVDAFEGSPTDWTGKIVKRMGGADALCERWKKNVGNRLGETVFIRQGLSEDVASRMPGVFFDIIIIDADHCYESTKADIQTWWPKLRRGGVMIGHDYMTAQFPGVDKAVAASFSPSTVRPFAVSAEHGGFWLVRKGDDGYCVGFPELPPAYEHPLT